MKKLLSDTHRHARAGRVRTDPRRRADGVADGSKAILVAILLTVLLLDQIAARMRRHLA